MESTKLNVKLQDVENRVQRACQQMLLLADKLDSLKTRYQNAVNANFKSFRYPLRMQIVTVEGVIEMYYKYTMEKQKEAGKLRYQLYGEEPDYDSEDDESDEEYMEQWTVAGLKLIRKGSFKSQ